MFIALIVIFVSLKFIFFILHNYYKCVGGRPDPSFLKEEFDNRWLKEQKAKKK